MSFGPVMDTSCQEIATNNPRNSSHRPKLASLDLSSSTGTESRFATPGSIPDIDRFPFPQSCSTPPPDIDLDETTIIDRSEVLAPRRLLQSGFASRHHSLGSGKHIHNQTFKPVCVGGIMRVEQETDNTGGEAQATRSSQVPRLSQTSRSMTSRNWRATAATNNTGSTISPISPVSEGNRTFFDHPITPPSTSPYPGVAWPPTPSTYNPNPNLQNHWGGFQHHLPATIPNLQFIPHDNSKMAEIYGYCFDRGNGQYTRLVPVDMLPPLKDIPARQSDSSGLIILPAPTKPGPEGRSINVGPAFELTSPPLAQGGMRDIQNQIDSIISSQLSPPPKEQKRTKVYCDKWVHEGVCAFTQQGCKYKHEMPLDKPTQHSLGLYHGLPSWYKKVQAELNREQREAMNQLSDKPIDVGPVRRHDGARNQRRDRPNVGPLTLPYAGASDDKSLRSAPLLYRSTGQTNDGDIPGGANTQTPSTALSNPVARFSNQFGPICPPARQFADVNRFSSLRVLSPREDDKELQHKD